MTQTLVIDPVDEDDIEQIVEENARDIGEDEWTIEGYERIEGMTYVNVTWGSESEQVFYVEERTNTTEDDRWKFKDMLEALDYEWERTEKGNWRIFRGGSPEEYQ